MLYKSYGGNYGYNSVFEIKVIFVYRMWWHTFSLTYFSKTMGHRVLSVYSSHCIVHAFQAGNLAVESLCSLGMASCIYKTAHKN